MQGTQLQWLGHVVGRGDEYTGKHVRKMQVERKKKGRPRRRWEDCVKQDNKRYGSMKVMLGKEASGDKKSTLVISINWD